VPSPHPYVCFLRGGLSGPTARLFIFGSRKPLPEKTCRLRGSNSGPPLRRLIWPAASTAGPPWLGGFCFVACCSKSVERAVGAVARHPGEAPFSMRRIRNAVAYDISLPSDNEHFDWCIYILISHRFILIALSTVYTTLHSNILCL
jgi:hypothetical protein